MSKPGEALAKAYQQNEQNAAKIGRRLESARKVHARRETERLRTQQAMLRAAMYARHPELVAA